MKMAIKRHFVIASEGVILLTARNQADGAKRSVPPPRAKHEGA
jgi:hypothetical protein